MNSMDMSAFGRATSSVPTQTFSASNFIGTPVPQIGQVGVVPTLGNTAGAGKRNHVAIIVALLVVGGYAAHHYFFEK